MESFEFAPSCELRAPLVSGNLFWARSDDLPESFPTFVPDIYTKNSTHPQKRSFKMLPKSVAVVGAGPVGCLAALGLAERGCSVDIYESRKDPRQEETSETIQRSINLAISTRGLTGLRSVNLNQGKVGGDSMDLADMVLADSVPMHARMIHLPNTSKDENGVDVRLDSQEYGINHEVSRKWE